MKGYFQTWTYVSKLRRFPLVGQLAVSIIQKICGLFGHEQSLTEWGYGGGDKADVWCRWCNHRWQIPYENLSIDLGPETKAIIKGNFFH